MGIFRSRNNRTTHKNSKSSVPRCHGEMKKNSDGVYTCRRDGCYSTYQGR